MERKISMMRRVPIELIKRIEDFQKQQNKNSYRPLKFTEAGRRFAETAITPSDRLNKGLSIIGKKWRFK